MHRSALQQRMSALRQRAVEPLQLAQHGAHLHDGVDAQVRPRAVRGTAGHLNLAPNEALVGHHQLQFGRLGDDGSVRRDAAQRLLNAEARMLLVGDRGDHHVPGQPESGHLPRGEQRRCDTGFHVISAAAVQAVRFDPWRMRRAHALHAYGVDVPTQQQSTTTPRAARANQHARTARSLLKPLRLEPRVTRPGFDQHCDLPLARTSGSQRRIHRVNGHQRGQQRCEIGRHAAIFGPALPPVLLHSRHEHLKHIIGFPALGGNRASCW